MKNEDREMCRRKTDRVKGHERLQKKKLWAEEKKVPLLQTINTLQAERERQPVAGKSRCAFEWQIRGIASLMHR